MTYETPLECAGEKQSAQKVEPTAVTKTRRGRNKKIWLQTLVDIPVELFDEICRSLQPLDLLQLARTSKDLRKYLMDRRREPLWKTARSNLDGLPECPSYLTEPAYANLLFCAHCHYCLTHNVHNIVFEFSTRCCNACRKTQFVTIFESNLRWCKIGKMWPLKIAGTRKYEVLYYKRDVDECAKVLAELKLQSPEHEAAVASRKKLNEEILKFSAACKAWLVARRALKSNDVELAKQKRLDDIVTRLESQGWSEELKNRDSTGFRLLLEADPRVQHAKPLSSRVWNNMLPNLTKAMEEARKERLDGERREGITHRMAVLDKAVSDFRWTSAAKYDAAYLPTLVDFAFMEPFQQLLDPALSPDPGLLENPGSEELWDQLELSTKSWEILVAEELATIVTSALQLEPACDLETLHSAWVVFSCSHCSNDELEYPEVVAHDCAYKKATLDPENVFPYLVMTACDNSQRLPWSSKHLTLNCRMVEARITVLNACLFSEPWTISRRFMEELDPRICCLECSNDMATHVSDWRTMATHWCHLFGHYFVEDLARVSDHLEAAVKCKESQFPVEQDAIGYKCSRCSPWTHNRLSSVARSDLKQHLSEKHGLIDALLTSPDAYITPETRLPKPRTMIVMTRPPGSEESSLRAMFDHARNMKLKIDVNCGVLLYEPPELSGPEGSFEAEATLDVEVPSEIEEPASSIVEPEDLHEPEY